MGERFDYTTHVRNSKGQIIRENPYRMQISKKGVRMERPPDSGIWFNPDGSRIENEIAVKAAPVEVKKTVAPVTVAPTVDAKISRADSIVRDVIGANKKQ